MFKKSNQDNIGVITVKIEIASCFSFWQAVKMRIMGKQAMERVLNEISDRFKNMDRKELGDI